MCAGIVALVAVACARDASAAQPQESLCGGDSRARLDLEFVDGQSATLAMTIPVQRSSGARQVAFEIVVQGCLLTSDVGLTFDAVAEDASGTTVADAVRVSGQMLEPNRLGITMTIESGDGDIDSKLARVGFVVSGEGLLIEPYRRTMTVDFDANRPVVFWIAFVLVILCVVALGMWTVRIARRERVRQSPESAQSRSVHRIDQ